MTARSHVGEKGPFRFKMKDLVDATGVPRQAIHFYIQEGLLPPGKKTGRNMAWYSEEHLRTLGIIRKLQQERFLPLKAIKAVLDGEGSHFSNEQRAFLGDVRTRLGAHVAPKDQATIDVDTLLANTGADRVDFDRAVELGMLGAAIDADGREVVQQSDAWLLELVGDVRRAGFTRELGFSIDAIAFYEGFMQKLVDEEARLLSSRLSALPPDVAAALVERAMPLIHRMLTHYHDNKVRDFFGSLL